MVASLPQNVNQQKSHPRGGFSVPPDSPEGEVGFLSFILFRSLTRHSPEGEGGL